MTDHAQKLADAVRGLMVKIPLTAQGLIYQYNADKAAIDALADYEAAQKENQTERGET